MAHQNTIKYNNYKNLTERINRFPQGAVASDLLFKILKILFSEKEAGLVSLLPIKPFSSKEAARKFGFFNPVHTTSFFPSLKQAIASQQFKSRYLAALIRKRN